MKALRKNVFIILLGLVGAASIVTLLSAVVGIALAIIGGFGYIVALVMYLDWRIPL